MTATIVLPRIALPPEEAKRKLLEYREALKDLPAEARHSADRLLAQAFYHAARGKQIVSLTEAVQVGGFESFEYQAQVNFRGRGVWDMETRTAKRPRIAIAPADAEQVWVHLDRDTAIYRFEHRDGGNNGQTRTISKDGKHIQVRAGETLTPARTWRDYIPDLVAKTPYVPPAVRPRLRSLGSFHLLWEATWALADPPPPVDPALLKHIGGDLFVVVDVWDLTDLEMAVLRHSR